MKKTVDSTSGHISNSIWKMALPVMLANLMNVVYNFADTFWVGKLSYSATAIAAVTVSFSVVFVLISFVSGLSVAASTLASQFFGAEKYNKIEELVYTSMTLFGIFAIFIISIGLIFSNDILHLLNTPADVYPYAQEYFKIIIIGMLFMFVSFLMASILRGVGDTVTPMKIEIISLSINMVLDPLLIFGIGPFPELGVAGAAYATVFARFFGTIYIILFTLSKKSPFKLHFKHYKFNIDITKKLFKVGLPAASTQVILSLGGTALIGRVNVFGEIATAAHGIGNRLDSLLFLPAMGLNQSAAIVVGQNIGAGQKERAKESAIYSLKMVFLLLIFIAGFLFAFPQLFYRIFSDNDNVISLGKYYVRYLAVGYPFIGLRIVMNGIFQGAGDSFIVLILSLVSLWVFRIPMAYLLSYTSLGIKGVWLGIGLSFIASALFMLYWFNKGNWLNKALIEKED